MLACFFLTEQGCILDLKKGVYLSKTNVTNRGSAPLEELSSSLGVSGDLQDTWTSAHAKIMGIAAYEDASGLLDWEDDAQSDFGFVKWRFVILYITKEWWFHANVNRGGWS